MACPHCETLKVLALLVYHHLPFQIKTKNKLFYLFKPFQDDVWFIAMLVYVLATFCYCILDFAAWRVRNRNTNGKYGNYTVAATWYIAQIWLSQSKLSGAHIYTHLNNLHLSFKTHSIHQIRQLFVSKTVTLWFHLMQWFVTNLNNMQWHTLWYISSVGWSVALGSHVCWFT